MERSRSDVEQQYHVDNDRLIWFCYFQIRIALNLYSLCDREFEFINLCKHAFKRRKAENIKILFKAMIKMAEAYSFKKIGATTKAS